MSIVRKDRYTKGYAPVVALVCGLGGMFSVAGAHATAPRFAGRSNSSAATATQVAGSANHELRERVAAALQSATYLDADHIDVSAERGAVVLRGFVFSEWDLRDALSAARKVAGDSPVIDSLSIKEGGR
jgi:BON domain